MAINRLDIVTQLGYGVQTGFLDGKRTYTPTRARFVEETTSNGAFETYADMGAVPWPKQNGGTLGSGGTTTNGHVEVTGSAAIGQGTTIVGGEERAITVYNAGWEVAFELSDDAIKDDRTGNLLRWARAAGRRFEQHMDWLCYAALDAGDGTTYGRAFDQLSFFNDSHVYPRASYTTAQDNKYALTLSMDNYETVRVAGELLNDSVGQPIGANHRLLIVPPQLRRIGVQIAKNDSEYQTANRAMNTYAGDVELLVAPGGYLNSTAWFLIDNTTGVMPLMLQIREPAQLQEPTFDPKGPDGGTWLYKIRGRYAVGYLDWTLAMMGNT